MQADGLAGLVVLMGFGWVVRAVVRDGAAAAVATGVFAAEALGVVASVEVGVLVAVTGALTGSGETSWSLQPVTAVRKTAAVRQCRAGRRMVRLLRIGSSAG
jgi:hypothetical protein